MIHVLSLGAGVQSSTLALMAAEGEIAPPDCAIFADTGWEPRAVYEWLHGYLAPRLTYPLHVVSAGDLRADQVTARARGSERNAGDARWASLPYFIRDRETGSPGMIRRQCTGEYKIRPIEKAVRGLLGLKPRQRWPTERAVTQWYGISLDELQRTKLELDPAALWRVNRYPLIELRMTRHDCLAWMERHGHPRPPRSACIGCPFHSNREWREMRNERPDEFADAVQFDRAIRKSGGVRGDTYLHQDRIPLEEVDLNAPEDHGQLSLLDECEGMCGV